MKSIGHALRAGWSRNATVATSGTVSTAVENKYGFELGMVVPAAFTGTAVTFSVSADNVTFQPLYDTTNAAVGLTVAQGRSYDVPSSVNTWPYFKVTCGSAQAAARTIVFVIKG